MSTNPTSRSVTPTDVVLARFYYPLLVQLAETKTITTYGDFVEMAKAKFPKIPEIQSAIPVSTGRRLAHVRRFTDRHNLPDLSAWIIGSTGKAGDAFLTFFDPEKERSDCEGVNWPEYEEHFAVYVQELEKNTIRIKRRNRAEAQAIMNQYASQLKSEIEKRIPNPQKLKYSTLVQPFRDPILELLLEGYDVEQAFQVAMLEHFA